MDKVKWTMDNWTLCNKQGYWTRTLEKRRCTFVLQTFEKRKSTTDKRTMGNGLKTTDIQECKKKAFDDGCETLDSDKRRLVNGQRTTNQEQLMVDDE